MTEDANAGYWFLNSHKIAPKTGLAALSLVDRGTWAWPVPTGPLYNISLAGVAQMPFIFSRYFQGLTSNLLDSANISSPSVCSLRP